MALPETHQVVVLYPPSFDVRVETVPAPRIEEPEDAIVKVKIAGLCGSDLHSYRGHEEFDQPFVSGHEFMGEVVALGSSYGSQTTHNFGLYPTLAVGDKVVSPFTSSCSECHFCRLGFTGRCESVLSFGSSQLPGGQAQYIRVPKGGGTLFKIPPDISTKEDKESSGWKTPSDSSLLLLGDILPTGMFAVLQTLQHPNVLPLATSVPFPLSSFTRGSAVPSAGFASTIAEGVPPIIEEDKRLTIAIIGLGPVGVCATVSLLDQLELGGYLGTHIVAIDPAESRRSTITKIVHKIGGVPGGGVFRAASIAEGKEIVAEWTGGAGCNAAMEIVGHSDALTLAYDIIRPFGVIVSVGAHQLEKIELTGRSLYDKNVSLTFGRCPVRAIFPFAAELLVKRQDVFGGVGEDTSLVDRIVGMDEVTVKESYTTFEKNLCGKILFNPWK